MKTRFLLLGVAAFFGVAYICANLVTDAGCCSHCKPSKYAVSSEAACGDGCTCDDRKNNR